MGRALVIRGGVGVSLDSDAGLSGIRRLRDVFPGGFVGGRLGSGIHRRRNPVAAEDQGNRPGDTDRPPWLDGNRPTETGGKGRPGNGGQDRPGNGRLLPENSGPDELYGLVLLSDPGRMRIGPGNMDVHAEALTQTERALKRKAISWSVGSGNPIAADA